MALQAGALDRRITIQRLTVTQDATGAPVESWSDHTTVWASRRNATGNEKFAAAQVNAQVDAVLAIRWRPDLDPKMRLLFDGEVYDIYELSELGRREGLLIKAKVRR